MTGKRLAYDVHVDDRKEAGFLCQLVLMFNFKKEQSPKLKAIYHQFMCGSTSKEAYQFYVHSLLEDLPDSESYLKLAISYWKAESFMIWELECPNEMAEEEKAKAVEDIQKDLVFLREIHEKVSGYDVAETISEFEKQLQDIIQGLITDEDSSVDGYMWR